VAVLILFLNLLLIPQQGLAQALSAPRREA